MVRGATEAGEFGLFPATDFRLVDGACADCKALKPAMWYFRGDAVVVPKDGVPAAGFAAGVAAQADVRAWYSSAPPEALNARPGLVWIGSPSLISEAQLLPSGDALRASGGTMQFTLTPKLASNRSYYDASTTAFFQQRSLRIRGRIETASNGAQSMIARTVWPQDYVIDGARAALAPLGANESLSGLVHQSVTDARFETRVLWERTAGAPRHWAGMAALGIMLNGAQGDDDEAHGGHFAISTGRVGTRGEWADWLVNNFYNLDSLSEKGINAAMVPMDNYLMDLNSGQAYYRPSYMLVALLRGDRAPLAYQGAVARVYNHFYRHDFRYSHAAENCAGISLDTLRSIGWEIPLRGATSQLKALAAYPYMAVKERSFASGRQSFDYLREEQTRLYPAVAFDAAGNDLLRLAGALPGARQARTDYERLLLDNLEAIVFVRIPQIPSSRAQGTYAVASIDEYMKRVPEDRAQWKIVPVDPRPFPAEFVNRDTEPEQQNSGAGVLMAGLVFVGGMVAVRTVRKRRARPH
jgi:hypothetical protein